MYVNYMWKCLKREKMAWKGHETAQYDNFGESCKNSRYVELSTNST
jgi:hypothetical protein